MSASIDNLDLHPCVREVLCALSEPVRAALAALLNGVTATLTAQIVAYEAIILSWQIQTIPGQLLLTGLSSARDVVRGNFSVVPLEAIRDCADLGEISLKVELYADRLVSGLEAKIRQLNRRLSAEEEIRALIDALEIEIDRYGRILSVLAEAGAGIGCE